MNKPLASALVLLLCVPAAVSFADNHRAPRPPSPPHPTSAPRTVGVQSVAHPGQPAHPQNNPQHEVIVHNAQTNRDERHPVVFDHRPPHVVDRDPHLRVVARGYHPRQNWGRFHPAPGAWFRTWGVAGWDSVGTVTCEAVNESTGALYPASQDRDARGWDDGAVDSILDAALDDCNDEAGGAQCGPATPSCSFQAY
jgi:hypothetical protein